MPERRLDLEQVAETLRARHAAGRTYSIVVVGGHYAEMRHYYKPEEKTCVLRKPKVVS